MDEKPLVTRQARSSELRRQRATGSPFRLKRLMQKRERMQVLQQKGVGEGRGECQPALRSGERQLENPTGKSALDSMEGGGPTGPGVSWSS